MVIIHSFAKCLEVIVFTVWENYSNNEENKYSSNYNVGRTWINVEKKYGKHTRKKDGLSFNTMSTNSLQASVDYIHDCTIFSSQYVKL